MSSRHNAKVRAERGGDEAARVRTDALKQAWPRDVVSHCDKLLAGPMPSSTYEALMGVMGWRGARDVPASMRLHSKPRGRPKLNDGKKRMYSVRSRGRARSRVLIRLKQNHPDQYQQLYQEELNKER